MTQPEDERGDRGSRKPREPVASGPAARADSTTQADAGMSGEESPANVEPHAEPVDPNSDDKEGEEGDDEQPPERDRHDRPDDDVAAAGTSEEREAISEDRDAAFHEPE